MEKNLKYNEHNSNEDKEELSTEEKKFRAYINKTICESAKDYYRRQKRLETREKKIIDDENYEDILETVTQINEHRDIDIELLVKDMLKTLQNNERNIIILNVFEGYSQKEIAEKLHMWNRSVSRIQRKAMEKMRKYIEEDK